MADSYSKWVMTNAFASNSQAALNTGNKIEWVALKTSDDTHALNDLPGFNDTTLATAKIKQTSSINSVVINGNTVTITGLFNSAGNTADYYIKTIFLVAKYNGAEFLAGATVANTSGSAFRMPAASTTEITEFTARPQISVTNSSTISTTVDPVAAATNERVNSLETSLNSKIEDINTDKQKLWNKFADYVTKATAETISGVKTFSQTIVGSITGNAGTATKLQTGRKLNGATFDGTADITVPTNGNDENIDGSKKFLNPISGSLLTRKATFTAFADVAKDMFTYSGQWANGSSEITDSPTSQIWLAINVIPGYDKTSGVIEVSAYSSWAGGYYCIGLVDSANIKWLQVSDDKNVLHKTGDENIDGVKNFIKKIKGNITNADVADVRTNSITDNQDISKITTSGYYAGRNVNGVQGIPSNFNGKYFDLTVWVNGSNGFMFIVDDSDHMYFRKRQNSVWLDYKPMPIDDTKLAHPSKDERISGNWSFDNEILGTATLSKRPVMFDLADGTDLNSIRIGGSYSCSSNRVGNSPVNNWFSLVVVQNGQYNGAQTLTDTNSGNVYTRVWNSSGNWFSPWENLSSDSKVIHNSGDETIHDKKTFDSITTFNNGIVNKPISMNGFKIDVSKLLSGTYNVWQGDISGCPADYGIVEVFENVSNTMYRFTQTNLPDVHVWIQLKNSFGFSGWKQQM